MFGVCRSFVYTRLLTGLQLYKRVVFNEAIPDRQKNKIVLAFSEVDKRLVDGADEHLTVLDLTLRIAGILREA